MTNSNYKLEIHGDPIERENIKFIDNKMNGYRQLWETFIGNENGYPPAVVGLSGKNVNNRYRLAEQLYSILLAFLSLERKRDYYLVSKSTLKDSFQIHEDTKVVFASISSIIDLLEKNMVLASVYEQKLKDKIEKVNKYMEERNEALHGRRLKIHINDNGEILIPKTEITDNPFLSHKNWSEYDQKELILFYEYLNNCIDELACIANDIFYKIFDNLNSIWANLSFTDIDYSVINNNQYSGVTHTVITIYK